MIFKFKVPLLCFALCLLVLMGVHNGCTRGIKVKPLESPPAADEQSLAQNLSESLTSELPETAKEKQTDKPSHLGLRAGEKLKLSIRWLGMEVGTADIEVKKDLEEIKGRKAYHIAVFVRSNSVIDIIYPVRDEHHSYVDAEHFYSLRYEKVLSEGRYKADEVLEFDHETHKGLYTSRRNGSKKQILIPKGIQDQISGAFWFRVQPFTPNTILTVPVSADERNWDLEVKIHQKESVTIKEIGTFEAIRLEPLIKFQGVFVHRGKMTGWMSTDEKRLPLMMKTKIPVLGSIQIVLVHYEGWD